MCPAFSFRLRIRLEVDPGIDRVEGGGGVHSSMSRGDWGEDDGMGGVIREGCEWGGGPWRWKKAVVTVRSLRPIYDSPVTASAFVS